jgi:hypothetical protein
VLRDLIAHTDSTDLHVLSYHFLNHRFVFGNAIFIDEKDAVLTVRIFDDNTRLLTPELGLLGKGFRTQVR